MTSEKRWRKKSDTNNFCSKSTIIGMCFKSDRLVKFGLGSLFLQDQLTLKDSVISNSVYIYTHTYIYIYIYIYEVHTISFQTFFVWALLLVVHSWNSSPFQSNLLRMQCACCTVSTISGRSHGSPLVFKCQWPSLQPLLSPQLSHNDTLWA